MAQRTKETLREVSPNLWVSDLSSASVLRPDFDLTIQCVPDPLPSCRGDHRVIVPSGGSPHSWSFRDLERITCLVRGALNLGKSVLIFCNRGQSRSASAAAAVLLDIGLCTAPDEAMKKVSSKRGRPAKASLDSVVRWWKAKRVA